MSATNAKMNRFANVNVEEKVIFDNIDARNTKKATATAVKVFKDYLRQKGKDDGFERYSVEDLDATLSKFYLEARSEKGEHYKKATLMSYRHGIQRHLEKTRKDIYIIRGSEFKNSTKSFKAMGKELKRIGRAVIDHYPPIADADMSKLYDYVCSSDSPVFLQYKVFIDLMLHFGRRGRENLAAMNITDLAVTTDADGDMYVYLCTDEQTKNHQDDSDRARGRMYERKDDPRCPVRSFVKYVRRLDKESLKLFQQPTSQEEDGVYYIGVPLGHNRLGSMMSTLSVKAGLSVRYTNHSLRATTVHLLDSAQVPSRHIMTVTGHKAESSLKTYTGYTDENTKKRMSKAISNKTCTSASVPSAASEYRDTDLSDFLNDSDFDMILQNIPLNDVQVQNRLSSNQNSLFQMPAPVLYNCTNVTINYNFPKHQ